MTKTNTPAARAGSPAPAVTQEPAGSPSLPPDFVMILIEAARAALSRWAREDVNRDVALLIEGVWTLTEYEAQIRAGEDVSGMEEGGDILQTVAEVVRGVVAVGGQWNGIEVALPKRKQ